jgi:hypothetical protein
MGNSMSGQVVVRITDPQAGTKWRVSGIFCLGEEIRLIFEDSSSVEGDHSIIKQTDLH